MAAGADVTCAKCNGKAFYLDRDHHRVCLLCGFHQAQPQPLPYVQGTERVNQRGRYDQLKGEPPNPRSIVR